MPDCSLSEIELSPACRVTCVLFGRSFCSCKITDVATILCMRTFHYVTGFQIMVPNHTFGFSTILHAQHWEMEFIAENVENTQEILWKYMCIHRNNNTLNYMNHFPKSRNLVMKMSWSPLKTFALYGWVCKTHQYLLAHHVQLDILPITVWLFY